MIAEVTDDPAQCRRAHVVGGIPGRTDEVDNPGTRAFCNLIEFVLEDEVLFFAAR
jgi:hypothetical protein